MTRIGEFLGVARKRVLRHQAVLWALRGTAAAAAGALVVELSLRRWPADPEWPRLAAAAMVGAVVAVAGWCWARPSLADVAVLADRRLGGLERLTTAWELAGHAAGGNQLALRQRGDAEAWVATADPRAVVRRRLPRRELGATVLAVALAGGLALLPNSSLTQLRQDQADDAVRQDAADEIAKLAAEVAAGAAVDEPVRRQALVRELQAIEVALREADTNTEGVAALSRAQENLLAMADLTSAPARDAATLAEAQLAKAATTARAAALSGTSGTGAEAAAATALQTLAEALPGLSGALSAASPDDVGAAKAAEKLADLAESLPEMTEPQRAALAAALEAAAAAAAADPALADSLRQAAGAANEARPGDLAAALLAAAQRAGRAQAAAALDVDVARASNGLESVKDRLLSDRAGQQSTGGQPNSAPAPPAPPGPAGACGAGHGHGAPPATRAPVTTATTTRPGAAPASTTTQVSGGDRSGCPRAPGSGEGEGGGAGEGNGRGGSEGQGTGGQGAGSGQGFGQGAGSGGVGKGLGPPRGGGGSGGASGTIGQTPGVANEAIFVAGLTRDGRTQALPSDSSGAGAGSSLVPHEQVYSQYRAEALSQADRQIMPERVRALLHDYFQEAQ